VNFMGVGLPEIGVILLVAFLVLGPNRSISMVRSAGKVLGNLRRTFSEVAAAANLEQQEDTPRRWDSSAPSQGKEPAPKAGDE
jgi:Sec-independent protein translocase protein TatA